MSGRLLAFLALATGARTFVVPTRPAAYPHRSTPPSANILTETVPVPKLKYQAKIEASAPSLRENVQGLSAQELAQAESLYKELTAHTNYLTGWPRGNTAEEDLRFALEVAFAAHRGQRRKSGEDFIIHPVHVAIILAQSRMDVASVSAGLLHDTVEDTPLTFEELESLFGREVRTIVEGETKVSKLPKIVLDGEREAQVAVEEESSSSSSSSISSRSSSSSSSSSGGGICPRGIFWAASSRPWRPASLRAAYFARLLGLHLRAASTSRGNSGS